MAALVRSPVLRRKNGNATTGEAIYEGNDEAAGNPGRGRASEQ